MAVDENYIKNLAEANGLNIPQERLGTVLRQYQSYLRTMEEIDTVPLERETEPAITFSNTLPSLMPGSGQERK